MEQEYVIDFYNKYGDEFSNTRWKAWPIVEKYVNEVEYGCKILDIGCGNGKNQIRDDVNWYSCDNSITMCTLNPKSNCVIADCTDLPYRDNEFDNIICIAVIHHLSTFERRVMAFKEIKRVMKKCGSALISVWENQEKYGSGDQYVKWKTENVKRYIHFFSKQEIIEIMKICEIENYEIVSDYNNLYVQIFLN